MPAFTKLTTILAAVLQSLNPWNHQIDVTYDSAPKGVDPWKNRDNLCVNPACLRAGQRLTHDIKFNVNPCDNFYQFACGDFMAGTNTDGTAATRFANNNYEIEYQIKSILQENSNRREPRFFESVKRFYQMCIDEKKMDDRGVAPGVAMLKNLGGWPVLGKWDPAKWNIVETAISAWHLGLEGHNLFELSIAVDFADQTKRVFRVDQPNMPIPREYLIKGEGNSMVKEYFQYMVDMAVFFGAASQTAEMAMRKVLQLQIEIAKVVVLEEERRGVQQYKQFTLKELDKFQNKLFDWRKLLEGLVSPRKLQDDQKIYVYNLEVIQKILASINGYPTEIVANYVMWNYSIKIAPYLTTAMRDRNRRFKQVLKGVKPPSRWQECMTHLEGLRLAVSAIYVNNFFDKSSRKTAKVMMNQIQNEMDKVLLEADWMDKKTREKARQKSAKMQHVVAYLDELADMKKVEDHYKELNLNKEHFFEARLELNIFLFKKAMRKLYEVSPRRPWQAYPMKPNAGASYWSSLNALVVNAGILQEPFFNASVPSYLNYASIGFIIGHEITHGFDDEGKEFNDEGELNEWWDEASLNKFNKRKQCFIDQYSSFIESVTRRNVNGIITQGENIADNGGMKLAFRAYRRVADQLKKPEPGLFGLLKYNNDQLFLISFANIWCSKKPFELIEHQLLTDWHAPAEWRVNGVVMNMPQFGDIFGCGKGTPMNPVDKCEVW